MKSSSLIQSELFRLPTHPFWQAEPKQIENSLAEASSSSSASSSVSADKAEEPSFRLIRAQVVDIQRAHKAYEHHPVDGYEIAEVDIIYNPFLEETFKNYLPLLNTRIDNFKYQPTWLQAVYNHQEMAFRQSVVAQYQGLSLPYRDKSYPNVHLLPLWHGTKEGIARFVFKGGYGIFTSNAPGIVTDDGFFGKGIYSAYEAEYAFRCYASQHGNEAVLLLNWVSFFSAYPVIDGDMPKLRGQKGGYAQCDAHFVPVRSDYHPNTDVYVPCTPWQRAHYTEVVVFNEAQCLPRYRVKLKRTMIDSPLAFFFSADYEEALRALRNKDTYFQVEGYFQRMARAGNAASFIRLQWLYSGEAELIPVTKANDIDSKSQLAQAVSALLPYAAPMSQNHAEAQFLLGWCYAQGIGVEQNTALACEYFWLAAEQGHVDAQYQLAKACSMGRGVAKDWAQSICYYEKAAENHQPQANYALMIVYAMGLGGINPNLALSALHQAQAKMAGYPTFIQAVEAHYEQGMHCEKELCYEEAAIAYHKAMDKGHTKARTSLGTFFIAGRGGCQKNAKQAYLFWQQSAEEGHQRAMLNLANQLKKGIGIEADVVAAAEWERKAKTLV